MLNYNTFEIILYWGLFAFAVFAGFYWQDEPSIAFTAFLFVAIFGFSKFYKTWLLEDEIERLEDSKKLLEDRVKEQNHQ